MPTLGSISVTIKREGDKATICTDAHVNGLEWKGAQPRALFRLSFAAIQTALAALPEESTTEGTWEHQHTTSEDINVTDDSVEVAAPLVDTRVVTGASDDEDETKATSPTELFNLRGRNIFRNQWRIARIHQQLLDEVQRTYERARSLPDVSDDQIRQLCRAMWAPVEQREALKKAADRLRVAAKDDELVEISQSVDAYLKATDPSTLE